ncbi:thermonuclease family protein [Bradyrhizobium lablabi]|uniref:thermonuclease family protein n=1 Tax=Bradyrhizobium lablabi TaxID=722472 RepID=UPI0012E3465C|nr:thermonuclease family protein [Bradyrhizobium lablabi]
MPVTVLSFLLDGDVDIYTIIFAALAVFMCLRLLRVLGLRTGSERRPSGGGFLNRLSMIAIVLVAVFYVAREVQRHLANPDAVTPKTTISGPARVVDGDTVVVAGTRVRLKGVDAAELGTPRGENARRVMATLVSGTVTCRLTGEKTDGREVGYCTTADGSDINRAIIAQGAALACPRYDTSYAPFEQKAALAAQPRSSYCVKR